MSYKFFTLITFVRRVFPVVESINAAIIILAFLCLSFGQCLANQQEPLIKIIKKNDDFMLFYQKKPFYVKGVVGAEFLEKAKLYGANSVRIWNSPKDAEHAKKLGLTVMFNLDVKAQRDGFNFDDTAAIQRQKEQIIKTIKSLKDNKSILFWSIGNELDYVPVLKPYDKRIWDVVEDIAKEIKKFDKDRLVLTVIGMSMMEKVAEIRDQCPSLDLLGINAYGDIEVVPGIVHQYKWSKPYLITEWGPTGYWQTKKTEWGAPFEETGSQKADMYLKRYQNVMMKDSVQCVGSYVFLWTSGKQETTQTWFGMFDKQGNESGAVNVMQKVWSGEDAANVAPRLDSLKINGHGYPQSIYLKPTELMMANVYTSDPDSDSIIIKWDLRKEAIYSDYAGSGEKTPQVIATNFNQINSTSIKFTAPEQKGLYRLFVYVYDFKGHFTTANLPFSIH